MSKYIKMTNNKKNINLGDDHMTHTNHMPEEKGLDHSLSLIREGYMYISNRRHSFNSNIFKTRLLGKKAICMVGKDAAKIFYDNEKFKRHNVAPNRAVQTLFGKNSVQTLDGEAHKHRKAMLMSVMNQDNLDRLTDITHKHWELALKKWEQKDKVVLYEEVQEIMCRTACEWAGVPVEEDKVKRLSKDLGAMFESAGATGPNHWAGRHARNRVEKWIQELVGSIRDGDMNPPKNTALHTFTWHLDLDGKLMEPETVAVEVINILRPIVAISIYISFIALALHHFPNEKKKVIVNEGSYDHMFVQEVRRFYPFFPFAIAEVKNSFIWNYYTFEEGTLTLLDLYGTNHDSDVWDEPNQFKPERFRNWEENPFNFIPQGGGDYLMDHRCAGEWVTIEIMKVSLNFLASQMDYEVPDQDLSFSLVSMPSIPKSKIVIKNVKRKK